MGKFLEMLDEEFDYDVIAGDEEIEFAISWDPEVTLTELALEKFGAVLDAECYLEDNILIFPDIKASAVREFAKAWAGYIPESLYESYFVWR